MENFGAGGVRTRWKPVLNNDFEEENQDFREYFKKFSPAAGFFWIGFRRVFGPPQAIFFRGILGYERCGKNLRKS